MIPPYNRPRIERFFNAQSPWNTPISAGAAVHPHSRKLIETNLLCQRPGLQINMHQWSVPVYFVDSSVKGVDVQCYYAKAHGDKPTFVDSAGKQWIEHNDAGLIIRDVPIPPDAVPDTSIALRPEVNADAHLCIVDLERRLEWDFCWMAKRDGQWIAGQGIMFDLDGDGVPPNYVGSARASGFPLTAGLIFRDEIEAGVINHPLVFAYNPAGSAHVYPPASTSDGPRAVNEHHWGIPEGALVQLDPQLDLDSLKLDRPARIIAQALQTYGMYLCDGAGGLVLYAENFPFVEPSPWDGLLSFDTPLQIPLDRMHVLDWGDRLFAERPKPSNWSLFRQADFFGPFQGEDLRRVLGPLNARRARGNLPPRSVE